MTDPFLDSLATALAGQLATGLGTAGKAAVRKIREVLQRRAEGDPETHAALEAAQQPSAGQPEIQALAERLDQVTQQDREFAEQVREARTVVHNEISAHDNSVVNHNTGNVGNLVQARDIQGGINFGG